jgi:hypothetical protein
VSTCDNLPVYGASYALLLEIFRCTRALIREYKYTLGQSLKNELVALITLIYRANSSQSDRALHIAAAREHIETIRLFVRLLHDLRQISLATFVALSERIENVSKQLLGWQRSVSGRGQNRGSL